MDEVASEGDQPVESERRETVAVRIGTGKERRSSVPRAAHGAWGPAPIGRIPSPCCSSPMAGVFRTCCLYGMDG